MQTAKIPESTLKAIETATVSVSQASRLIDLHPETIRRYIKRNELAATRIGVKGMWRIKLVDLAEKMGIDAAELGQDSLNRIAG